MGRGKLYVGGGGGGVKLYIGWLAIQNGRGEWTKHNIGGGDGQNLTWGEWEQLYIGEGEKWAKLYIGSYQFRMRHRIMPFTASLLNGNAAICFF